MLSKKTKYAFNALEFIAKQEQRPVSSRLIATEEGIPHKFLESILRDLTTAGILRSIRGKQGGYRLAKPPGEINLAMIMRLFEGPIALLCCVSENYYEPCGECNHEESCPIRMVFMEIRLKTIQVLQENTLQHILENSPST